MTKQQVKFHEFGNPSDVLEVSNLEESRVLENGQIRVAVSFSPINPADINYIQGVYGVKPELPAVPGLEATGVVLESNSDQVQTGDKIIYSPRDIRVFLRSSPTGLIILSIDISNLTAAPDLPV